MLRVPKLGPKRAIHLTTFPQPMYRSAAGEYKRYDPAYAKAVKDELGLEMVQGPDMPLAIEKRRQEMIDAQERYEAAVAEERARQAYNRRVAAWNSYRDLSRRARQFYPNVRKIREDMSLRYPDMSREEIMEATRNPETLDTWYNGQKYKEDKIQGAYGGYNFDYSPYPGVESFEEFPDELVSMPWWELFGERRGY